MKCEGQVVWWIIRKGAKIQDESIIHFQYRNDQQHGCLLNDRQRIRFGCQSNENLIYILIKL